MESNNFSKGLRNSLKFLDNEFVFWIIVIILFLYNTCIFMNINDFFSNMYEFGIVRVIILLLILYVSQKSYLIALLLAMSYLLSVKFNKENFESMMNSQDSMNNSEYDGESDESIHHDNSEEMEKYNNMIDSSAMDFNAEDQKMGVDNQFADKTSDEMEGFNNNLFTSRSLDFNEEDQDMGVNNQFGDSKMKETFTSEESSNSMMDNSLNRTECLQNYDPEHQKVGDLCKPVATFEGEYNAQGLNYPIGYNMN